MDILTTLTTTLMPIVQHPYFKRCCYAIAVLTLIALIYFIIKSRIETKEALKKKEITHVSHPWSTVISIIFLLSLSLGVMADITDWNEPGKITVLDNGKVITKPKPYFLLGRKPSAVYEQTLTYAPPKESIKKEEPVTMTFKDYGSAQVDYQFEMALPDKPEQIKKLHEKFGNQEKLVSSGAKPYIAEALKIGARLLRSEESSIEKEKKLQEFVKDQLEKGHYVVQDGKIKRDEKGRVIRKYHPFTELEVKFPRFGLKNFHHEELVKNLVEEKNKVILELKKMEGIDLEKSPVLDVLQQQIEKHINNSKGLTNEQKKMINHSIRNIRRIIETLKERDEKRKKDKKGGKE